LRANGNSATNYRRFALRLERYVLAALVLTAGCQPLPHPFADSAVMPGGPPLRPPDGVGVIVLPVQNAPAPAATAVAAALAASLRDQDVPASTEAQNRGSYRLVATTAAEPEGAGRIGVTLDWQLRNAADRIVGSGSARGAGTDAAWLSGNKPFADALAHTAAPAIVRLVMGDAPPAANVAATVKVGGIAGAPGDGSASLARAIVTALGRAGIDVAPAGAEAARYTLSCRIETAPAPAGKERVSVRWKLAGPNGRAIGQVAQENMLPAGTLDGPWGDIAYAVAGAAAPGISQLIERANTAASGG
jgi:hypothetical protein